MSRPVGIDNIKFYTRNKIPLKKDGCIALCEAVILSAIKERDYNFFLLDENIYLAITDLNPQAVIDEHFSGKKNPLTDRICKNKRLPNKQQIERRKFFFLKLTGFIEQGKTNQEMADELNVSRQVIDHYKHLLKLAGI